ADCLTLLLLRALIAHRGSPLQPLLLYAWSPLPVLYFGLDGHIDALGILCVVLAISLFLREKPLRGAAALGAGALAKLVPLIIVPLLLRGLRGATRILVPLLVALIVLAGALIFYEPTWGVVQSLTTFGSRWEFNGSVFSIFYFFTGNNETAHIVSGALIALLIGTLTVIERPLTEKVFWGFAGFILLSPVVHPWYLTWIAALLPLRWSPGMFLLLGMSCVANVVVYQYHASGAWNDQPLLLLIEYIPPFILLARELLRGEVLVSSGGRADS
ncbi:MAG TPA: hypothetical protein VMM80_02695, partial [Bacteroidota bacterium]|nr:hypothetical protein [Bacteroidota bacterium]